MQNKALFEQNGVDLVHFYNVSTPIVNNAYTVCLLLNKQLNRIEARGVAICSVMDTYNIIKGKQKAFGRAIKALKRKQNFFKINGKARKDERVQRSMKIKSGDDDKVFRNEIVPELYTIDPCTPIKVYDNTGDKYLKRYTFTLPLSYPIEIANKNFKYKSQYRPLPVGEEVNLMTKLENNVIQSKSE